MTLPQKILRFIAALSILVSPFQGCKVTEQARMASNLVNCDFQIRSVENVNLGGVNFQYIHSISDLGISDMARLLAIFASPSFPLSLQINLVGRNPNASPAGLNRLEWILFIDDVQMTTGILDKPFVIPANNGTAVIPVAIGMDLKQALNGESAQALINFAMNLAGIGNKASRIKIKIKPTIMIGGSAITYPGYFPVKTEFTGK